MQAGAIRRVLNETDAYREFAPPPWARHAVACFWVRRGDGSSVAVLPDACTDIVWRSGQGAVVAGPDRHAWRSHTRPDELILGARLLPGAGGAALGLPLSELLDARVALGGLGVNAPGALCESAGDDEHAAATLIAFTLGRVAAAPPDAAVQAAARALRDPAQRIEALADRLGFSERQLRRRFAAAVGYGPKTLQRVLRLRCFLGALASGASVGGGPVGPISLAGAAAAAGYADQAHLTRECRALTGRTPAELADAAGRPGRRVHATPDARRPA